MNGGSNRGGSAGRPRISGIELPGGGSDVLPPESSDLDDTLLPRHVPPAACTAGVSRVTVRPAASNCGALDLGVVRALEKGTQEKDTCRTSTPLSTSCQLNSLFLALLICRDGCGIGIHIDDASASCTDECAAAAALSNHPSSYFIRPADRTDE